MATRPKSTSLRPLKADEVINIAIEENRFGERLLYTFAILFVAIGVIVMVIGAWKGNMVTGSLGLLSSALFIPAMQSARRTKQESVVIRLLQAPLLQAENSKEAAEAIRIVFIDTFTRKSNAQTKKPPEA